MKRKIIQLLTVLFCSSAIASAQQIEWTPEQIKAYSEGYTGPRSADGRPMISDNLIKRLANISIEEAWGFLRNKGYHNQFDAGWTIIGDGVLVGRAVTSQYMPLRPDVDEKIKAQGEAEGRIGAPNSWPIDVLTHGDVYVADGFGKVVDGTLIGDNLGNAIYAKSGTGVVFDAGARDVEGLERIKGFTGFVRGLDPSYIQGMMMTCINCPIRIGRATVMPGDLVLGKKEGVIFIPAMYAQDLIMNAEFVALRDEFGHMRLREGKYTPGEIDRRWTDNIKQDFLAWIKAHPEKLQMTPKEFDDYMKERNW
ncbi:RraA family protein [Jiulongibacter sediminis]|uniref:Dimethylmenaquinone methyltransferase n=1 Tax=Jiulongibacter sediminis TaxID=1605367 RepID=A0A0P7BVL8_9BACT|nr:dimethylmenaquinone methyltransferase [Jiulongibacter sediminis]KPM48986.1 dimethylmenaquinone methyltransferase [Jiulongibacter sediminis]TBX25514.1 dimethylmenaquinone methyltransferase [Jiulongibacter sediminis]